MCHLKLYIVIRIQNARAQRRLNECYVTRTGKLRYDCSASIRDINTIVYMIGHIQYCILIQMFDVKSLTDLISVNFLVVPQIIWACVVLINILR